MNAMFSTLSWAAALQRCSGVTGTNCRCHGRRNALLRYPADADSESQSVPRVVHDVLGASGRPIDAAPRARLEAHFGRDFSGIRVHDGSPAAAAAQAVSARAFTVGHDLVFGAGQYAPGSSSGMVLLAHELTHALQQQQWSRPDLRLLELDDPASPSEREASQTATAFSNRKPEAVAEGSARWVQRDAVRRPTPTPIDADAEKIVAVVMNEKRSLEMRAIELVYRILNRYYSGYSSKVRLVGFDNAKAKDGLQVDQYQDPSTKTFYGEIYVGERYINDLMKDKYSFADHVAKVGHELEHIDQWRSGLTGSGTKDQREFLAHYHEATFVVPEGAGAMHHNTRARHLDAALGLYYCLPAKLQTDYASLKRGLLARRPKEVKYGHSEEYPTAPSTCKQPSDFGFD